MSAVHRSMPLRLGISVAGPLVTAVVIDDRDHIVSVGTSDDGALATAVAAALEPVGPGAIGPVMLATTAFADLLEEHRTIGRVAVLRIGATPTTAVPPFAGWPRAVAERVAGPWLTTGGGTDIDGSVNGELDADAIRAFAGRCRDDCDAIAVSGSFSYLDDGPERAAAALIADALGTEVSITLSHEVGGFGLLERENAAILNAALSGHARGMPAGLRSALGETGLETEPFLARSDGTLVSASRASALPVHLVAGRLATSVQGRARLAGTTDAIVVDGDGRSLNAGVMRHGRLVLEPASTLAGVRTNQPMPLGFPKPAPMTEDRLIGRLRRRVGDLPVLGPPASAPGVASAVGAALAAVSASVWSFAGAEGDRAVRLAECERRAIDEAILAGADPSDTEIRQVVDTQVTYMSGGPLRLFVQAAGRPFHPIAEYHET
ncbi:hydantoinase/oxoprolinase N-terminal domain-containing protein [Spongiactinospora sp. 9N601]|uniref:hydantoinase/oxoprolinase N-terminal domain-containing protein n=1 Tax=Spongiactinospora sp. 9N601 TaxID=3375149 RepID=UPI0037A26006